MKGLQGAVGVGEVESSVLMTLFDTQWYNGLLGGEPTSDELLLMYGLQDGMKACPHRNV